MTTTDFLKIFLSDTYALMLKTHAFHWNVTGANFRDLHLLFEEQYRDLFEAADVIAERIRAKGDHPPGGIRTYAQMSSVDDPRLGFSAEDMLNILIADHEKLTDHAKKAITEATQVSDDATADILIGRVQQHEKQIWLMGSILGGAAKRQILGGKAERKVRRA